MTDYFRPSKYLCLAAAMVLPLSSEKQDWIRLGGDAGDVYKNSIAVDVTSKLHYGASSHDAMNFLKHVCVQNRKVGRKLKFEFRRVIGRVDKDRCWCVKSLIKTVLANKGIYILFGKSKLKNAEHKALLKRIGKAEGVEDKVETYSKKATGFSRHDHAVSIRSDENGVRLFDNACTAGSVEFTVENLADKMADLTYCFFFDLYKKGWKKASQPPGSTPASGSIPLGK
jgi:hypothetical protein